MTHREEQRETERGNSKPDRLPCSEAKQAMTLNKRYLYRGDQLPAIEKHTALWLVLRKMDVYLKD